MKYGSTKPANRMATKIIAMPRRMVSDLPRVRRRRELHRDGERHQEVTGFAPRAGEDERDHDHDEHREVRVVLHVDEPMSEVREVQVQERKQVPPRVQEIPEGQPDEQRGEQQDHAVEPDANRRSYGIQPRRREQAPPADTELIPPWSTSPSRAVSVQGAPWCTCRADHSTRPWRRTNCRSCPCRRSRTGERR